MKLQKLFKRHSIEEIAADEKLIVEAEANVNPTASRYSQKRFWDRKSH
ncbi:MAG: hypothetical protein JO077_13450 [Verrucomicrobia bacterium]|nr:hypothetical protein [Verrucomicrobiota bacterium]